MVYRGHLMFRTQTSYLLAIALCASLALTQSSTLSAQTAESPDSRSTLKSNRQEREKYRQRRYDALRTRPGYSERELRENNLSDIEIRQIEQATHAVVPGAIVNIGGVWAACPCEDGIDCNNQVWVVAELPGRSTGVMLSKIDDRWGIGPVQEWWFDYEDYEAQYRDLNLRRARADYTQMPALNEERSAMLALQIQLINRFPYCDTEKSDASSG